MTIDELNERLSQKEIVSLKTEEWSRLADHFKELERHETFLVGDLFILRGEIGLVAVEQPSDNNRVVRRLSSVDEKNRFVQQRLDTYERMWDGCGCKIDYYK